jgi:hypothetical protein
MSLRQWAPRIREQLATRGLATDFAFDKTWLAWEEGPEMRGVVSLAGHPRGGFDAFMGVRYEPAMAVFAAISGIDPATTGMNGLVGCTLRGEAGRWNHWAGSPEGLSEFADDVIRFGLPWVESHATLEDQERFLRKDPGTHEAVALAALLLCQNRRDEALGLMAEVRQWVVREAPALLPGFDEEIERARTIDADRVIREWTPVR